MAKTKRKPTVATTDTTVKIDKHIPLPPRRAAAQKYPFDRMEVGDSFWTPTWHVTGLVTKYGRALNRKFTTRTEERGTTRGRRVWRVR